MLRKSLHSIRNVVFFVISSGLYLVMFFLGTVSHYHRNNKEAAPRKPEAQI